MLAETEPNYAQKRCHGMPKMWRKMGEMSLLGRIRRSTISHRILGSVLGRMQNRIATRCVFTTHSLFFWVWGFLFESQSHGRMNKSMAHTRLFCPLTSKHIPMQDNLIQILIPPRNRHPKACCNKWLGRRLSLFCNIHHSAYSTLLRKPTEPNTWEQVLPSPQK